MAVLLSDSAFSVKLCHNCGDKMVIILSYLHNQNSFIGKMPPLHSLPLRRSHGTLMHLCSLGCLWWVQSVIHTPVVGLLSQFPPFHYFPNFSASPKYTWVIAYHVNIWQVSPQLSCSDTCQISMLCKLEQLECLRPEIPPLPHYYPWFTSDPKSKQDKVKLLI